jgi:FkbM family methyltransferase
MAMKQMIKRLAGPSLIRTIRKFFPSKVQRDSDKKNKEEVFWRSAFYAQFVKKGELCFDVGANTGNRIRPLLQLGARVVAVEPQESCYRYLETAFGSRITLIKKGAGAGAGEKDFYISSGSPMSSFSKEWIDSVKDERFSAYHWNAPVKVDMTTLDELIASYGMPVFIKIDVEGYESEVLKGLSHPVQMISFEYTVPEQTGQTITCLELIEKNGGRLECNYSEGESMQFALEKWLPAAEMKNYLVSAPFIASGFGDIYVRNVV